MEIKGIEVIQYMTTKKASPRERLLRIMKKS
jgi:hypothetical protein